MADEKLSELQGKHEEALLKMKAQEKTMQDNKVRFEKVYV